MFLSNASNALADDPLDEFCRSLKVIENDAATVFKNIASSDPRGHNGQGMRFYEGHQIIFGASCYLREEVRMQKNYYSCKFPANALPGTSRDEKLNALVEIVSSCYGREMDHMNIDRRWGDFYRYQFDKATQLIVESIGAKDYVVSVMRYGQRPQ